MPSGFPLRGARPRRTISFRSSCGQQSARTISTTAPGFDTLLRWPAGPGHDIRFRAMTNSIREIEGNEVIFIIGSNTKESHPS